MTGTDQAQVSDTELAERVQKAVDKVFSLHVWSESVSVTVKDGAVDLAGHVRTTALKHRLDTAIWSLQGVLTVKNELIVDTELERTVAQALAADPRTAGGFPGILVGSAFGEVFLKGKVNSQDVKKAAEEIARGVPNVRSVVNDLSAPEPPKPAAPAKPAPAKPAPKPAPKEEGEGDNEE
jgi:osmotically-inducible protein OsmY